MTTRRSFLAFTAGCLALPILPAAAQTALAAKTSDAGGVRVVVKPKTVVGAAWEFDVTMDTHTKPLDDDLTKAAVLVDDAGHRYAAAAWQGDAPGGHHRQGVLRFPAPSAPVKSFELQLQGVGGVNQRIFQWTVN